MAKSRRAKAVEAPKKPTVKNVQKSAPAKKVAKSKDVKMPAKKAATKEPPKKVVASKNEVKKPETPKEKLTPAGDATKSLVRFFKIDIFWQGHKFFKKIARFKVDRLEFPPIFDLF